MAVLAEVSPRRLLVGTAASATVIALAVLVSAATGTGRAAATTFDRSRPVATAVPARSLPASMQPYARAAGACPGLDPLLLAAIHDVETRRDAVGGTSAAGAVGPMQFLPATWAAYGSDGNGDGVADPWNLDDALAGASRLLCANGVSDRASTATAVWNYNHSWSYVDAVLVRAASLHRELEI